MAIKRMNHVSSIRLDKKETSFLFLCSTFRNFANKSNSI